MHRDAWRTYEHWRQLWLSGGNSHGIGAVRFHGLRGAVELAGCEEAPAQSPPPGFPSPVAAEGLVGDAALAEAARQIRHLLGLEGGTRAHP